MMYAVHGTKYLAAFEAGHLIGCCKAASSSTTGRG